MLRPLVESTRDVPWYVNCTPGGRMFHIEQEISAYDGTLSRCIIWCGTNDLCRGTSMMDESIKKMLDAAKKKFAKVFLLVTLYILDKHLLLTDKRCAQLNINCFPSKRLRKYTDMMRSNIFHVFFIYP